MCALSLGIMSDFPTWSAEPQESIVLHAGNKNVIKILLVIIYFMWFVLRHGLMEGYDLL